MSSQPNPEQKQPGPTDVTLEEALAEMTEMYGQAAQQLAVAQIKVRKQDALINQLQEELTEGKTVTKENS